MKKPMVKKIQKQERKRHIYVYIRLLANKKKFEKKVNLNIQTQ